MASVGKVGAAAEERRGDALGLGGLLAGRGQEAVLDATGASLQRVQRVLRRVDVDDRAQAVGVGLADQRGQRFAGQLVAARLAIVHDLDHVGLALQKPLQRRQGGLGIAGLVGAGRVVVEDKGPAVDAGEVRAGEAQAGAVERPRALALADLAVDVDGAAEVHDGGDAARQEGGQRRVERRLGRLGRGLRDAAQVGVRFPQTGQQVTAAAVQDLGARGVRRAPASSAQRR